MKNAEIIKTINTHFIENWNETEIVFDGRRDVASLEEYIFINFISTGSSRLYLGSKEGIKTTGLLRIYAYSQNPTRCYEIIDEIDEFISNKKINDVFIAEIGEVISPAFSEDGMNLYSAVIDFDIES